jgi:glyoxylase-like metal-dependent hydrolase (beta-lactamase superfamily II)
MQSAGVLVQVSHQKFIKEQPINVKEEDNIMLFRPQKTGILKNNLYVANSIINNFYIMNTGKHFIMFDSGINPFLSRRRLHQLGLDPSKVSHVFLTHSDYDHAGGLKAFPNAKVYLSSHEEPMITYKKPRRLILFNRSIPNHKLMEDRQEITIDQTTLQIIFTPGHTPGSACYLIDKHILVTGDSMLVSREGKIGPFSIFMDMKHSQSKNSLAMLHQEGFLKQGTLLLTGHTGAATI